MDAAQRPRIGGLLESSLYVRDLAASRGFYERIFGFEVFGEDPRMCVLGVPGGTLLLLFRIDGSQHPSFTPGGIIPPHGAHGVQHLCFSIPISQLQVWAAHLDANDVPVESRVVQAFGGTSLYFRDPDGHSLEVATPGLWPSY